MKRSFLDREISCLKIDSDIVCLLKSNNILFVKDLWMLDRNSLKNIGFSDSQINNIKIKMQLCGLDLNKKIYTKQ